jgi:tRNA-modifying protein YgfZ
MTDATTMTLDAFPLQRLPDRAVISLSGDGALAWLDNLITCGLTSLEEGHGAYGALLTPQGKILHDFFVYRDQHRLLLDCAAEHRTALVQKLVMYRLRAKLVIEAADELHIAVSSSNPDRALMFPDPRLSAMGWRGFITANEISTGHGYESRRLSIGLADSTKNIGTGQVFPHETNLDQFGGVSFTKGCYVGQEVVSRMQHRGTARNRFLPVHINGPLTERKITSGDTLIGEISSVEGHMGLALIRLDRLAEVKAPLKTGRADVRVVPPDWIKYDVTIPEIAK